MNMKMRRFTALALVIVSILKSMSLCDTNRDENG